MQIGLRLPVAMKKAAAHDPYDVVARGTNVRLRVFGVNRIRVRAERRLVGTQQQRGVTQAHHVLDEPLGCLLGLVEVGIVVHVGYYTRDVDAAEKVYIFQERRSADDFTRYIVNHGENVTDVSSIGTGAPVWVDETNRFVRRDNKLGYRYRQPSERCSR